VLGLLFLVVIVDEYCVAAEFVKNVVLAGVGSVTVSNIL
jgi:hypothetical protein